MTDAIVSINELTYTFQNEPRPAVDRLTASVYPAEVTGLVGADGAGKTTLIRLIVGLLLPSSGSVSVLGFDSAREANKIHPLIGYMPQKFGLYEDLSVIENLSLYADLRGLVDKQRDETFKRLLKFTDLAEFTDRLAGALSGGMKQKLGLACALVQKPKLLLLDEPSVGVDPISRRELWQMVQELVDDGIGVIWSTAYLDEAEKCGHVLLLHEGKLLFEGPPKELTDRVSGRTFQVQGFEGNRRRLLTQALEKDGIIDGVLQGEYVRIVVAEGKEDSVAHILEVKEPAKLVPVAPRFEDSFIDILGGGPGGRSELANRKDVNGGKQEKVVEAKDLTKKFGSFTAVDNITFSVQSGEIFGFLGPNGAGKSTTFKMMCGLLKPSYGTALVTGLDLQAAPSKARARIGYMAQKFSLYGNITVRQNLDFFSGVYGLWGKQRTDAVDAVIDIFALEPYLAKPAGDLPPGFKQRLALGCAVMHDPPVLFLDEPTSGVDPITRREFWTHINGLIERGVTVMVTTHFMDEAEYCDRIGLIYRGQIIATGSPDDLKESARTEDRPEPTMEDAFIALVESYDRDRGVGK
jgi:drug efflux transport system ATP-binding protein